MKVVQVTSDVREAMVEFISKARQSADGTVRSQGGAGGKRDSLPPLTKEDEKMGGGSKTYQTCSSVKATGPGALEKAVVAIAAANQAQQAQTDYVRVNLEVPSPTENAAVVAGIHHEVANTATTDNGLSEK
jgi:hypothetical protein